MSAAVPIPMLSYDSAWKARWEEAERRFKSLGHLVRGVDSAAVCGASLDKLKEDWRRAGRDMGAAFVAQFRTSDEYGRWRMKWFRNQLPGRGCFVSDLASGLTEEEIHRRLRAAQEVFNRARQAGLGGPDVRDEFTINSLLTADPSSVAGSPEEVVQQTGGDDVR